jgi:hypothetical protein
MAGQISRRDMRTCREVVHELSDECATGEDFLRTVGRLAGGSAAILRMDRQAWLGIMPGAVTGLTLPYPGGWLSIVPDAHVAEATVFGHEAAHILFGDIPHWDRAREETRRTVAPLVETLGPEPLLEAVGTGDVESVWRHGDGMVESRAEFLGALLESRLMRPHAYARDHIDDFFFVRDDR